jgi:hypothetical protein
VAGFIYEPSIYGNVTSAILLLIKRKMRNISRSCGLKLMERGEHIYDPPRDPVRSIFQGGLREALPACHDPLPMQMERMVAHLQELDRNVGRNYAAGGFESCDHSCQWVG